MPQAMTSTMPVTTRSTHISADHQLRLYTAGIDALGGNRRAAHSLGLNERTIERLRKGAHPLRTWHLYGLANALLRHADQCRALERRISPAFAENLTAEQL
jgi:hypothetical protein